MGAIDFNYTMMHGSTNIKIDQ